MSDVSFTCVACNAMGRRCALHIGTRPFGGSSPPELPFEPSGINCPPGCREHHEPPGRDPRCECGKPLHISLRPGEHIHPCPVHPDYVVRGGPRVTF